MQKKRIQIEQLEQLSEPIERYTIQFFRNSNPADPNHYPESLGSGVLLKNGEDHYIATAAHVIENEDNTHIGVYSRIKDFFELGFVCKSNDVSIDIAVWKVEANIAADIAPDDWWYPIEDSIFSHQEVSDERYLIYGFPEKKYKIDIKSNGIHQFPIKFITKGYSSNPHSRGINHNEAVNILLEFHKDKVIDIRTGNREHAPEPYGISGCGVWYYEGNEFHLVGIMTEWKQPTDRIPALMATKIDYVLEAIKYIESLTAYKGL